jgi:hypothetical protein
MLISDANLRREKRTLAASLSWRSKMFMKEATQINRD